MDVDKTGDPTSVESTKAKDDSNTAKLKRAALASLSAAAVKAKLLANQEEDEIRQLATLLIEKQVSYPRKYIRRKQTAVAFHFKN